MKPLRQIFPILFFLISLSFYGQGENLGKKKQQIKAMKVAFLTTELQLTSSEAEKFWPMYNTFDDKQFELRHQKMKAFMKQIHDDSFQTLSDKEALVLLNQMEANEDEMYALRKKFTKDLRDILPAKKIIQLKKSEEDFNRKLLQQYRGQH